MRERQPNSNIIDFPGPKAILDKHPLTHFQKNEVLHMHDKGIIPAKALTFLGFLKFKIQERFTAKHEAGHEGTTLRLGGDVNETSIQRSGPVSGFTSIRFGGLNYQELAEKLMASLWGGYVAEERSGETDHRGTGSDVGKIRSIARSVSGILGRTQEDLISESYSHAVNIGPSSSELSDRADELQLAQGVRFDVMETAA